MLGTFHTKMRSLSSMLSRMERRFITTKKKKYHDVGILWSRKRNHHPSRGCHLYHSMRRTDDVSAFRAMAATMITVTAMTFSFVATERINLTALSSRNDKDDGNNPHTTRSSNDTNDKGPQTDDKATAYFPTLDAHLVLCDTEEATTTTTTTATGTMPQARLQSIHLNTPVVLHNQHFQGTVLLNVLPLDPGHDPNFCHDKDPNFSIQLSGRIQQPRRIKQGSLRTAAETEHDETNNTQQYHRHPFDNLYMGAQIAIPMTMDATLGSWGKYICHVLLRLLNTQIQGDMRYSFGSATELPHISFPVETAMDTKIHIHPSHPHNDDDSTHCTMTFQASSIDLAAWKVTRPFEMPLERLWGTGTPIQLIVYHQDKDTPDSPRTYLLQLQLTPKQHTSVPHAQAILTQ